MIINLDNGDLKRQIEFLLGMEVELTADEINILAHATIGNEWVLKVLDKLGLTINDIIYERDRDILTGELSKLYKQPESSTEKQNQIVDANKMVTAVDWLVNQVEDFYCLLPVDIIEQAKQMEKEQMIDFGKKCQMVHDVEYGDGGVTLLFTPEQLFEETYKTQSQ